jgi:glycosyltransferase involved in cell wall biosynthesis
MRGLPVAPSNVMVTRMPGETTSLVVNDATRTAVQEAVNWADVVLWRVPQECQWECRNCDFVTNSESVARRHALTTNHEPYPDDVSLRRLWYGVRRDRVGVLFDVDRRDEPDDLWWIASPFRAQVSGWAYPLDSADLVTASTPRLARYCERFNPGRVRVVRNSIDVSEFVPTQPRPEGKAVRLVWYGPSVRVGEWTGDASSAAADHGDLVRTVAVGADPGSIAEFASLHAAGFDQVFQAVGFRDWPRHLANAWPEIGAVPLRPNQFNGCRSEEHWLEFAALGCPAIVQRWRGPMGPYSCVRDGVDGLLARGRQEWSEAVGALAGSAQLRADIGGAARERVLREYRPEDRAGEMAAALRWAAEHPASGRSVA